MHITLLQFKIMFNYSKDNFQFTTCKVIHDVEWEKMLVSLAWETPPINNYVRNLGKVGFMDRYKYIAIYLSVIKINSVLI